MTLFYSCKLNNEKIFILDDQKIIGSIFNPNELPYGNDGIYGKKYISGIHYITFSVLYKNKIIVYIREPLKTGCFYRFPCSFSPYGLRNVLFLSENLKKTEVFRDYHYL